MYRYFVPVLDIGGVNYYGALSKVYPLNFKE